MLIGIDASSANRAQKTGVEWYSYYLIEELKRIIPENVGVVLYSAESLKGELSILPKSWQSKIIRSPVKSPFAKKAWLWTQLRLSWEMIFNQPDVLFVPSHAMPLIHPRKTITTIHDIGFLRYPEAYNKYARLYHRFSSWFASQFAYRIIVPSEFTKKELMEIYKTPHWKIFITHLGYDKEQYNMERTIDNAVIKNYGIENSYYLFVGRVEEKKNVLGLVRAFNEARQALGADYELVILGMPGFGFQKIFDEIKNLNLTDKIKILGYTKAEDVPVFYRNTIALVLPSFYEGFGIPILEAMACGAPVVAANAASIPEVAGDAAILVQPEKTGNLAYSMRAVLDDLTRKILIEKGFERIKNFSWEKTARETWKILEK